jgi:hypothetical protein
VPVILDAKRGDIGATAEQYAREAFERYGADALTVNPYMGFDSVEPWLAWKERGVIILCRTSNPGGSDLQFLETGRDASCTSTSPNWWRRNGTPAASARWWSAPPSRPSWPRCAASSATCRCWCRASAPRAATSRQQSVPAGRSPAPA